MRNLLQRKATVYRHYRKSPRLRRDLLSHVVLSGRLIECTGSIPSVADVLLTILPGELRERTDLAAPFATLIVLVAGLIGTVPFHLAAQTLESARVPVTLGGILHSDSDDTLAFTPDGNTVFFDRSEGPRKTIMVSHRMGESWSPARIASFSGRWFDQNPVVAPDGTYLLFDSDRPIEPGGKRLTQNHFAGGEGPGSNIWRVDRIGSSWGKPYGSVLQSTMTCLSTFPPLLATTHSTSCAGMRKRRQCIFGAHGMNEGNISLPKW